jgi:hypothetical protein
VGWIRPPNSLLFLYPFFNGLQVLALPLAPPASTRAPSFPPPCRPFGDSHAPSQQQHMFKLLSNPYGP